MSQASAPQRNIAIDAARGAALLAMFGYHFTWDLALLGFIDGAVPQMPILKIYAHAVAWSFLLIVGVSLVCAARNGLRWIKFVRRLAIIGAAAAAITLVTLILFPDQFIFFGILHCILVSSVLALPFLRAPLPVVAGAAAVCLAAPLVVALPFFDAPIWWWLGLGTHTPPTNDYAPFLPGFGIVLGGITLARAMPAMPLTQATALRAPPIRILALAGRHSLPIYLLHQPIFLAPLFLLAQATGTHPATEKELFLAACIKNCGAAAATHAFCEKSCTCAADRLAASPYWRLVFAPRISLQERDAILSIESACLNP